MIEQFRSFVLSRASLTLIALLAGVLLVATSLSAQEEITGDASSTPLTPEQQRAIEQEVDRRLDEHARRLWSFGVKPDGEGIYAHSPDLYYQLRLLGLVQLIGTLADQDFHNSFGTGDVHLPRARIATAFLLKQKYELFLEYDGAPDSGNLVEARADITWMDGGLRMRAGKMIVPLSEEGWRRPHELETIHRFIALNAVHGLPAEDSQVGVLFHGRILENDRLTWYMGAWNGNASRESTPRDDNDDKEFQIKGTWAFSSELRAGAAVGFSREEDQLLNLSSLTGTPYAEFAVQGERFAQDVDFVWERGRNSVRGELLRMDFRDADAELTGGFLQFSHFLWGDDDAGLQPIVRLERAEVRTGQSRAGERDAAINALTAGVNWHVNNHVKLQVNAIAEDFSRPSNLSVSGDGMKVSLLTQVGMRF